MFKTKANRRPKTWCGHIQGGSCQHSRALSHSARRPCLALAHTWFCKKWKPLLRTPQFLYCSYILPKAFSFKAYSRPPVWNWCWASPRVRTPQEASHKGPGPPPAPHKTSHWHFCLPLRTPTDSTGVSSGDAHWGFIPHSRLLCFLDFFWDVDIRCFSFSPVPKLHSIWHTLHLLYGLGFSCLIDPIKPKIKMKFAFLFLVSLVAHGCFQRIRRRNPGFTPHPSNQNFKSLNFQQYTKISFSWLHEF